jgi:transcriptional regulator with XRE-family HTH domain
MDAGERNDGEKDALAVAVGVRLAALRNDRGWDLVDLARRTGMSDKYIWRVENGLVTPGLRNLARLAVAFEMTLAGLLEDVELPGDPGANRPYVATRTPGRPRGTRSTE